MKHADATESFPTPRTDSCYTGKWLVGDTNVEMVRADFARDLERELAIALKALGQRNEELQTMRAVVDETPVSETAMPSNPQPGGKATPSATAMPDPAKALAAKLNELDAARYRFLRNWDGPIQGPDEKPLRVTRVHNVRLGADAPTGDRLDQAIDEAMRGEYVHGESK